MRHSEIETHGRYIALVSGELVVVRVTSVRHELAPNNGTRWAYDVINEATGRNHTFRSVRKFRRAVREGE
jgi:hypothetical protein